MTFKPEKEKKIIIFVNYVTIYLITHMGLLISFNVWQYQIQSRGVTREENRAADCQRSNIRELGQARHRQPAGYPQVEWIVIKGKRGATLQINMMEKITNI